MNPRTIKGDTWWDGVRKEAYAKNNFCCWACGIPKHRARFRNRLEAHEYHEIDYAKGSAEVVEVVALCIPCHHFIHSGRLMALHRKGKINNSRANYTMRHGLQLLRHADLQINETQAMTILDLYDIEVIELNEEELEFVNNPTHFEGRAADWEDWHLILEGEKHYSKFKDLMEWVEYYENQ